MEREPEAGDQSRLALAVRVRHACGRLWPISLSKESTEMRSSKARHTAQSIQLELHQHRPT